MSFVRSAERFHGPPGFSLYNRSKRQNCGSLMIIVHGTFPIRAEVRDDAIPLMREMVVASRSEYGCVSYEFYVGLTDPNTLLLFQEWESVEALQGHYETDHMEDFLKALPGVLDGEITTRRYEVRSQDNDQDELDDEDLMEPPSAPEPKDRIIH